MGKEKTVLIVAASGRALAASARRGGYVPLVADRFGDQDTLAAAAGHVWVDLNRPIDGEKLISALGDLLAGRDCAGIVCGTGFEDDAGLLARIGRRWQLIGNAAETVARLKDPLGFAEICAAANVPHPETSLAPPPEKANWLIKRAGGAGGWHIRPADGAAKLAKDTYFQRKVDGVPISALILGDGQGRIMFCGFTLQWPAPTLRHPFRYGGAVRPVEVDEATKRSMIAAVERICGVIALKGLNSADFMVDGKAFHLLEINPRPSATFDLFETEEKSLFALHVDACHGTLPAAPPAFEDAMAGVIVYAQHDLVAPAIEWPQWTADRPVAGSQIRSEQPLCSVFARALDAHRARRLVEERISAVHELLDVSV